MHHERMVLATEEDVHDRTRRYFGDLYSRIEEYPVLVIGAGAIGTEVVKNLVMMGVRTIHLVDFDMVSASNLNRCVFFKPSDHNVTFKVHAICRHVQSIWPQCRILPYPMAIEKAPDKVWRVPLVIVAVDNNEARYHINLRVLSSKPVPFVVNGATGRSFLDVEVLLPKTTACLLCSWGEEYFNELFSDMVKESCDRFFHKIVEHFPAISVLNSLAGAIMASEAVKILVGLESWRKARKWESEHVPLLGQSLRYDIRTHEFSVAPLRPNPRCVEIFCRTACSRRQIKGPRGR